MLIFFAIALFGVILLIGGSIFGHDHDHDGGHDSDSDHGGSEPTVSIFSVKVIGVFIMGFGAAGTIAKYYDADNVIASISGLCFGLFLGLCMYMFLRLIYGQQANSMVRTEEAIGKNGIVTIEIGPNSVGKVEVSIGDISQIYMAQGKENKSFRKGERIKVIDCHGSQLIVDKN